MSVNSYHLPADKQGYAPDRTEPVDRWLQAENASNVRTTAAIVRDLCPAGVDSFFDPFAGGGSSAAAARILGLPFAGIELDPVLACVCLAKAVSTPRHALALADHPVVHHPEDLRVVLGAAADQHGPEDAIAISCLALVSCVRAATGRPMAPGDIADDLAAARAPHPDNRVIWGDATTVESWAALPSARGHAVIYTSPPFGEVSPRLPTPDPIRQAAREILTNAGLRRTAAEPATFAAYQEITLSMLRRAVTHLPSATLIIEHEPADDGHDARESVVTQIEAELADVVRKVHILESGAFSWRGKLSFIVCEVQR